MANKNTDNQAFINTINSKAVKSLSKAYNKTKDIVYDMVTHAAKESPDLKLRVVWGVVMLLVALVAIIAGGALFNILILSCAIIIAFEWSGLVHMDVCKDKKRWYIYGFFYVLTPAASLLVLRNLSEGLSITLWLFILIWCTDIAAFFVGKRFGSKKLAPQISPGKTWAGLFGGIGFSTFISTILFLFFSPEDSIGFFAFLAATITISITSQVSDLLESLIKRRFGVKDSSNLIPGHGGMMDRLDSITLTAPVLLMFYFLHSALFVAS